MIEDLNYNAYKKHNPNNNQPAAEENMGEGNWPELRGTWNVSGLRGVVSLDDGRYLEWLNEEWDIVYVHVDNDHK